LLVAADCFFTLESKSLFNFLVLGQNLGMIDVSATVKMSHDLNGLLP
jgi:hypothetical protein